MIGLDWPAECNSYPGFRGFIVYFACTGCGIVYKWQLSAPGWRGEAPEFHHGGTALITTTFAAVALSVLLTGETSVALTPTWQTDYSKAMTVASAQQKPIAVFIGRGEVAKLAGDAAMPSEAEQILARNYVCVCVNTDTPAGKALATDFAMSTGLIISNKGGSYQALRHTGDVSAVALTGYLTQYGDTTKVTTTAERGLVPAGYTAPVQQYTIPGYYPGGVYPGTRCVGSR
jgi:hypothetical protein